MLALKKDGSLWSCGSKEDGQIGNDLKGVTYKISFLDYLCQPTPLKIMDNVIMISAGDYFSIAIKKDGSLWGWGENTNKEIGVSGGNKPTGGMAIYQTVPLKLKGFDDVIAIDASNSCAIILKKDRSIWYLDDDVEYKELTSDVMLPTKNMLYLTPKTVKLTNSKLNLDKKLINCNAYLIDGNNYFKLRDIAHMLSGTKKQFDVRWDNESQSINLISNNSYTIVGGEMNFIIDSDNKKAIYSSVSIYKDSIRIHLDAYTIDGNNYFKLRDIAKLFDFGVDWDENTNSININTLEKYNDK